MRTADVSREVCYHGKDLDRFRTSEHITGCVFHGEHGHVLPCHQIVVYRVYDICFLTVHTFSSRVVKVPGAILYR